VSRPRDSRHTSGGASLLHRGLAAWLVAYTCPMCALLAPGHPGAALRDYATNRADGTLAPDDGSAPCARRVFQRFSARLHKMADDIGEDESTLRAVQFLRAETRKG